MASSELQNSISKLLKPIDCAGNPATSVPLQDETVSEIKRLLKQHGDEDGGKRPRTYALLYLSHLIRFHNAFRGLSDDHLPYTDWTLPDGFRNEEGACKRFLELQTLVITEEMQKQGPRVRRHVMFADVEHCPLISIKQLGQGSFGVVDSVKGRYSGKCYARKTFQHRDSEDKIDLFKKELEVLENLRHHHLVRYVGSYMDPKWMALTMLPIAEEDLSSWIPRHLGDRLIERFFGCLASAVAYLHKENVRHKDIKLRNVLVHRNEIFLSDFGSSQKWKDSDESVTDGKVAYAYTKRYAPPEVLDEDPRNRASDIFSLGCVFLELFSALYNRPVDDVLQYLREHGTTSDWYADNRSAVESWVGLLEEKALKPTHKSILDMIVLMMEADKNKRPIASMLAGGIIDQGAQFACRECHREHTIRYLASKDVRVGESRENGEALCEAVCKRNLDIFQHLLKITDNLSFKSCIFNGFKMTALGIAVELDYVEMVEIFLSHCRSNSLIPDMTGELAYAIFKERNRSVELLLDFGVDPYKPGGAWPRSSLYYASGRNLEALEMMVNRGVDLTHRDSSTGRSTLHAAIRQRNCEALQYLLTQAIDVNAKDSSGVTPLHEAVILGEEKIVALLCQEGVDPNIYDGEGFSPFERAVQINSGQMIAPLISAGADPRKFDNYGKTMACWAAHWENLEALEAILDCSGSKNHYDKSGRSPLHFAVRAGCESIVRLLLKKTQTDLHRAENTTKQTPLHYAAEFSSEEIVKILLAQPQIPSRATDSFGYTPLQRAMKTRQDYHSITRLLVNRDPGSLNIKDGAGVTPLGRACTDGPADFVRFLVEKGADLELSVDDKGNRPLQMVVSKERISTARLLLDLGAQVDTRDSQGCTLLHGAARNGHKGMVALLVERGASVEATDPTGDTALLSAASKGYSEVVEILKTRRNGINHTISGKTLLMIASEQGRITAVQTLLDAGANINLRDSNRQSALMFAIEHERTEAAKLLIERGCEAETKNAQDTNPLMLAAYENNTDVVRALINRGVSLEVQNQSGNTALSKAAHRGHAEIARLLVDSGAKIDVAGPGNPTPLFRAAYCGHEETARILLEKGADLGRAIRFGRTCSFVHRQSALRLLEDLQRFRSSRGRRSRLSLDWNSSH